MKLLNNKGNTAVVLCLMITVLFGFTAFAIDIGVVYIEKAKLTNALDSAALAAALELPNSVAKAKSTAEDYLRLNNVDPSEAVIEFGADKKFVTIRSGKEVKHFFAPVIGINSSRVKMNTKALVAPVKSVKGGIRPLAVEAFDYTYGSVVILKQYAGGGYHGNYGPVALGGTGESVFKMNSLYGYTGKISIGDVIYTETGNMSGATNAIGDYINSEYSSFDNFSRDSIRLWTLPLVDTLYVDGRKAVTVVGFGEFYVEKISKGAGQMEITGRFVRYVANGEIDMTVKDTGVYGVKLAK